MHDGSRRRVSGVSSSVAFLAAARWWGSFIREWRGEGERVPNPGAALSLSFSLSLSPHSDTSASPALSLCKPSLFTLTAPFLLDFTSHTLECFETTHTLAFTPVFSDLVKLLWRRQRPKRRPTSVKFRRVFRPEISPELRRPVVEPAASSFEFGSVFRGQRCS